MPSLKGDRGAGAPDLAPALKDPLAVLSGGEVQEEIRRVSDFHPHVPTLHRGQQRSVAEVGLQRLHVGGARDDTTSSLWPQIWVPMGLQLAREAMASEWWIVRHG